MHSFDITVVPLYAQFYNVQSSERELSVYSHCVFFCSSGAVPVRRHAAVAQESAARVEVLGGRRDPRHTRKQTAATTTHIF